MSATTSGTASARDSAARGTDAAVPPTRAPVLSAIRPPPAVSLWPPAPPPRPLAHFRGG